MTPPSEVRKEVACAKRRAEQLNQPTIETTKKWFMHLGSFNFRLGAPGAAGPATLPNPVTVADVVSEECFHGLAAPDCIATVDTVILAAFLRIEVEEYGIDLAGKAGRADQGFLRGRVVRHVTVSFPIAGA